MYFKLSNTVKKIFNKKKIIVSFENIDKKVIVGKGEPPYTLGAQKWKGAIVILKNKFINIKNKNKYIFKKILL